MSKAQAKRTRKSTQVLRSTCFSVKRTSDAAAAILVKGLFSASQKERRLCGDRDENRDLFTNYYRIPSHPYSLRIHYQKIRGTKHAH